MAIANPGIGRNFLCPIIISGQAGKYVTPLTVIVAETNGKKYNS